MKKIAYKINTISLTGFLFGACALFPASSFGEEIAVAPLASAPVIDGDGSDWAGAKSYAVALDGDLSMKEVILSAGTYGDEIFILAKWKDDDADEQHKPYVWNSDKKKYEKGSQKEDRFAIQFAMEGDYSVNWLSGKYFKADTWHWKAARSNPIGLAQDKMTIVGGIAAKKAYKAKGPSGEDIYIQRPSDSGDKLYKTKRYRGYEKDVMPKYILTSAPSGSITDVKAVGRWSDGEWVLEMKRKLDTGHADDVKFSSGSTVQGGIAVFDKSGNDKHNLSSLLQFVFE